MGFNPEYIEESTTIKQIREMTGYAILEFGAPWCEHCQAALPVVREVLLKYELPHIKLYDGKGKILGRRFKVKFWPTLILLNSGTEIGRSVRPVKSSEVRALLALIQ